MHLALIVSTAVAVASWLPSAAVHAPAAALVITADTVREYRGRYETGFEISWFHPCDAPRGDDTWWITLTDDALRQRDSLAKRLPAGATGTVFVRWRGTTSMKMRAGHMGRGTRYMLVHEVLDLRPQSPEDCATATAPAAPPAQTGAGRALSAPPA